MEVKEKSQQGTYSSPLLPILSAPQFFQNQLRLILEDTTACCTYVSLTHFKVKLCTTLLNRGNCTHTASPSPPSPEASTAPWWGRVPGSSWLLHFPAQQEYSPLVCPHAPAKQQESLLNISSSKQQLVCSSRS